MPEQQLEFRKANMQDAPEIWAILQEAIERRRLDGSDQWQDGYPNLSTVENDIFQARNYVLVLNRKIIATAALIFNEEPAYEKIEGAWLSEGEFLVVHRVAVSDEVAGKGFATRFFTYFEDFAKGNGVYSIKVDTNFDNLAMLRILEKLDYTYCGEVDMRGSPRKAFEKVLV